MTLPVNYKLEDLFNLSRSEDTGIATSSDEDNGASNNIKLNLPIMPETLATLDRIEAALPTVRNLEASDLEMDDLAAKATESFDDLMSLGMQIDSRYASEIFSVAGTMLGHAITAKTAKMNKKLRMIDLQLKKARIEQSEDLVHKTPNATGRVLNRNDLLRSLLADSSETPDADK